MKRPWELFLAAVLTISLLFGCLWVLASYVRAYHKPVQNWLRQGSFRATDTGGPEGWVAGSQVSVLQERSSAHVPLRFLRLCDGEPVWTEMALEPGWRLLHVSGWFRLQARSNQQTGIVRGQFFNPGGAEVAVQEIRYQGQTDEEWHLREAIWTRPAGSVTLRVSLIWEGERGGLDLSEVSIIPSYLFNEQRKLPTH